MFKKESKNLFIIMLMLLLIAGIFFVMRSMKQEGILEKLLPAIHVVHTDVTSITDEKITMLSKIRLKNRMPVNFSIDSVDYIIFLEDKEIMRSLYPRAIDLDANGISIIELPLTISYNKIGDMFERMHKAGKDSTRLRLDVLLYSSLIPKDSAWVHIDQKIPVIVLPTIHLDKIKVSNLTASGARLNLSMMVVNENTMRFAFKDSKYRVIFEEHKAIEGVVPQTINLPAKDSVRVTIPLDLNFKQIGQTLADLIRKGTNIKYDVRVATRPVSDVESLKNSEIILHSTGKLKTIKEAYTQ